MCSSADTFPNPLESAAFLFITEDYLLAFLLCTKRAYTHRHICDLHRCHINKEQGSVKNKKMKIVISDLE